MVLSKEIHICSVLMKMLYIIICVAFLYVTDNHSTV